MARSCHISSTAHAIPGSRCSRTHHNHHRNCETRNRSNTRTNRNKRNRYINRNNRNNRSNRDNCDNRDAHNNCNNRHNRNNHDNRDNRNIRSSKAYLTQQSNSKRINGTVMSHLIDSPRNSSTTLSVPLPGRFNRFAHSARPSYTKTPRVMTTKVVIPGRRSRTDSRHTSTWAICFQ